LQAAFGGLIGDTHEVRDGHLHVSQRPGLGRVIDAEGLEARRVATL
jgi:L-alanine-DL-glutamate epimerase-like enolase superfamily enzyme